MCTLFLPHSLSVRAVWIMTFKLKNKNHFTRGGVCLWFGCWHECSHDKCTLLPTVNLQQNYHFFFFVFQRGVCFSMWPLPLNCVCAVSCVCVHVCVNDGAVCHSFLLRTCVKLLFITFCAEREMMFYFSFCRFALALWSEVRKWFMVFHSVSSWNNCNFGFAHYVQKSHHFYHTLSLALCTLSVWVTKMSGFRF